MQFIYVRAQALDADYIDLGPEALLIKRCMSTRNDVEVVDVIGSVTNIYRALDSASQLAVLHISAHGDRRGILLEDTHTASHLLSSDELQGFMNKRAPRLLVLAACQSAILARDVALTGRVPHIIATCVSRAIFMNANV